MRLFLSFISGIALVAVAVFAWFKLAIEYPEIDQVEIPSGAHNSQPAVVSETALSNESKSPDPGFTLREAIIITRPAQPIAEVHDALVARASDGDGTAAVELYRGLHACVGIPRTRQELDSAVLEVRTTGVYDGIYWEDPTSWINRLETLFEYCEGISDELAKGYYDWLKYAAVLGVLQAQIEFSTMVPRETLDWDPQTANQAAQEIISEWVGTSLRYFQLAAEQGSVEAMNWLALTYHQGVMVERDPARAYSYIYAAVAALDAAGVTKRSHYALLEMLERDLLPHQLEEAKRRGAEYLANPACCVLDGRDP